MLVSPKSEFCGKSDAECVDVDVSAVRRDFSNRRLCRIVFGLCDSRPPDDSGRGVRNGITDDSNPASDSVMDPESAAILTLVTYGLVAIGLVARKIRQCREGWGAWFLYVIERAYVPLMFRWRATNGPCPFPAEGGAILLGNHRSPVDPLLIWMNHHLRVGGSREMRVPSFLTAKEYCSVPGLTWLVRTMQSIPVERDGTDMGPTREAIRRLKDGRIVGIFPEGGINFGTDLREANPGIAFLALKAKVPVYPVFIHGAPQEGRNMLVPFMTRCRTRVTYGEPIDLSEYYGRRSTPELLAEVTDLLMSRLASLGGVGFTPVKLENGNSEPNANGRQNGRRRSGRPAASGAAEVVEEVTAPGS